MRRRQEKDSSGVVFDLGTHWVDRERGGGGGGGSGVGTLKDGKENKQIKMCSCDEYER